MGKFGGNKSSGSSSKTQGGGSSGSKDGLKSIPTKAWNDVMVPGSKKRTAFALNAAGQGSPYDEAPIGGALELLAAG